MNDYEMDREILEQLAELEENADTAEKARGVAEIYEKAYSTLVEDSESNEEILQCEQSLLNAIKWFKKAYEYGDSIAAIDIADSYLTLAQTGSTEYADEAIQWCETAKKHSDLSTHMSEIENIIADSQKVKQEIISFVEKSRNQSSGQENKQDAKKGGCLKKILVWGIAIILFISWINSCTDNSESNTDSSVSNQVEDSAHQTQVNSNDDLSPANDLFYLTYQSLYASKNGIQLNNFAKERNVVISNIENASNSFLHVNVDNILGADRYKLTAESSNYVYNGSTKDNYADGFGVLLKYSDFGYGAIEVDGRYYNIVYIGHFEEGRFSGYGLKFYEPDGNEHAIFKNRCSYEPTSEEYLAYYHGWLNYAEYEGMFKNGKKNGLGNSYYADLELRSYLPDIAVETTISDVQYDELIIGSFENDEANGKCKVYTVGTLIYDGEMKNSQKHGFGCLYNNEGQLEYEGNFKNDMKDGKGKLYDANGNIIYDGDWKMDDYK